jgi:lipopolysaccharide export LptBFGC system permease protein LptF
MKIRAISFGVLCSAGAMLLALILAVPVGKYFGYDQVLPPPTAEARSYYDDELVALQKAHKNFLDEMKENLQSDSWSLQISFLSSKYWGLSMLLFGLISIPFAYVSVRRSYKWQAVGYLSSSAIALIFVGIIFLG